MAGTVVARGPDGEPLITNPTPVARLDDAVLDEADALYSDRFKTGRPAGE